MTRRKSSGQYATGQMSTASILDMRVFKDTICKAINPAAGVCALLLLYSMLAVLHLQRPLHGLSGFLWSRIRSGALKLNMRKLGGYARGLPRGILESVRCISTPNSAQFWIVISKADESDWSRTRSVDLWSTTSIFLFPLRHSCNSHKVIDPPNSTYRLVVQMISN